MAVDLTANAFITVDELKAHLGRAVSSQETDVDDRAANAINASTAWLEEWTTRALKARNHKRPVTTTGTASTGNASLTLASVSGVNEGDDVFAPAGIAYGTRIASLSGLVATISPVTTAALTGAAVSLGSRALIISGDGTSTMLVPEHPVLELFGVYELDTDGTRTALDTTGYRLSRAGVLHLPNDTFTLGDLNIEIECRAGYEAPLGTKVADVTSLDLKRIAYRAAEVFFLQAKVPMGRTDEFSLGSSSSRRTPDWMPADLIADVRRYQRLA